MPAPVLHMLTPSPHVSPFDVNMALEAGFGAIVPYTRVTLAVVAGLAQDAMFSSQPDTGVRSGIFIGGRDVLLALDMLEAARARLVPPYQVSLFADPAGAFTAAAATIARVEKALPACPLSDRTIAVIGATGPVGFATALLLAEQGARVRMIGHRRIERLAQRSVVVEGRFGTRIDYVDGSCPELVVAAIADAQVLISAATAGVRVLDTATLAGAPNLLLAVDLNAVPPSGIEGIAPDADGLTAGAAPWLAIGPAAIGELKNHVQTSLLRRMIETPAPVILDFRDALELARSLLA